MMIKSVISHILTSLSLLFGTFLQVSAQAQAKFPLRVGDKMPEIEFHTIVNYPGGKAKLSDFVGKPVILDLWHVQCSACIAGMPQMQHLQQKFGHKIQIIGFGMNSLSDYKKLKKNSSILRAITTLPLALQADTSLFKNLVDAYPRHIWIDEKGIIKSITHGENATDQHVQDFIDGKELTFVMGKPLNALPSLGDTSLLVVARGKEVKKLQYHSLFTGRLEYSKLNFGDFLRFGPNKPGFRVINATFLELLQMGFSSKTINNHDRKLVFESDDLKRFLKPKNDDDLDRWYVDNTYCYELSLPEGKKYSMETMMEYLRQDMLRFFNVKVEYRPYLTNCLVLYRLDSVDRIKTKGGTKNRNYDNGMNAGITYNNVPISRIAGSIQTNLSHRQEPVKVIDETHYMDNVDIKFDSKLDNVELVRAGLKKYGLDLKEEKRVVDCIVLSKTE